MICHLTTPNPASELRQVPVYAIPPDTIKINKQHTPPKLRRIQHVRLSQVAENQTLIVKSVESLGNVSADIELRLR